MATVSRVFQPSQGKSVPARRGFGLDKLFLVLVVLYLIVPLGATLAFGLSGANGIGFSTYQQILSDPNFSATLLISLGLAFASTILAVVLVTPTVYWVPTASTTSTSFDGLSLAGALRGTSDCALFGAGRGLREQQHVGECALFGVGAIAKQSPVQHRQYIASAGLQLCDYRVTVCLSPYR